MKKTSSTIENHKCQKMTKFFMRLLGMWPPDTPGEKIFADSVLLLAINMMVISSFAMTFDFWFQRNNFYEIVYVIPCVSVTYAELTKLLVFFFNRKDVLDFIMFTQNYFLRRNYKQEHLQILQKCDETNYPRCAILIFIVQGVTWHYIFIPICENIGRDESERTLVFRWYFDLIPYTTSPYYEWVMLVQVISTFYVGVMFIASAIFLFTINVYSAAYFDILKHRFETLCEFDQLTDKKESYTETEDLYYKKLIGCIKEHETLIQYVNKIDYLYKSIMFVQVFSSVMQICFSGFQLILGASTSIQRTILSGEYVIGSFVELYFFTVSSDQIRFSSIEVQDAAYHSKWHSLAFNKNGKNFRTSLAFVIFRANYPSVVHMGSFGVMSHQIFTWVLRTSGSYFTVLRQFMEQSEMNDL